MKDNKENLSEIQKFCINPQLLEILGIDGLQLQRVYRSFGEVYKFIKDDKTYSIHINLDGDVYDKSINYIELERHMGDGHTSMGIGLVRLDNISTIEHLRKFRKLMDVYFSDYIIKEDVNNKSITD